MEDFSNGSRELMMKFVSNMCPVSNIHPLLESILWVWSRDLVMLEEVCCVLNDRCVKIAECGSSGRSPVVLVCLAGEIALPVRFLRCVQLIS